MDSKFGRLKSMVDSSFKIIENIEDNAYKLELPNDYDISHTFNVKDLRLYHGEELRLILFHNGFLSLGGFFGW